MIACIVHPTALENYLSDPMRTKWCDLMPASWNSGALETKTADQVGAKMNRLKERAATPFELELCISVGFNS
jgi:hypothetical protein